jgi:hypothetical protein
VYAARINNTISGNTYTGNTKDYIEVQADYIEDNGTFVWAIDNGPYVVVGDVYVQRNNNSQQRSTLQIASGTTVKFTSGSDLFIGHESYSSYRGALTATGRVLPVNVLPVIVGWEPAFASIPSVLFRIVLLVIVGLDDVQYMPSVAFSIVQLSSKQLAS